jgi:hypothetical protein
VRGNTCHRSCKSPRKHSQEAGAIQLALFEDNLVECKHWIDERLVVESANAFPAPSWTQLSNELTRCMYLECQQAWQEVVDAAERAEAEVSRRHFKALRVGFLCGKARAFSHLGRFAHAEAALALAARCCPTGAVDPLVVLEASQGVFLTLRGATLQGDVHFERALAACRAIGHRYYERWIEKYRNNLTHVNREDATSRQRPLDATNVATLMSDVATILGAAHSIELLADRTVAILRGAFRDDRIRLRREAEGTSQDPSCCWEQATNGNFRIRPNTQQPISIEVGRCARLMRCR